jgi:hypothetical protein
MKKLFAFAVIALAVLLAPSANAATVTNVTWNGEALASATPGSTITVNMRVVVGVGERLHFIKTTVSGSSLDPVPHKVGGTTGLLEGTHNVNLTFKVPTITGNYTLDYDLVSRFDSGAVNDVEDYTPGVVHSTGSASGFIRVLPNASPSTPPVGSPSEQPSWFSAFFAQLLAILKPAPTAACTTFNQYASLSYGNTGSQVKAYQLFLIGQGENTKPTGFFGPLTLAAEAHFASSHNCSN